MIHSLLWWIIGTSVELVVFCLICGSILNTVFFYSRHENVVTNLTLPLGILSGLLMLFRNDLWWLVPTAIVAGVGFLSLPSIALTLDKRKEREDMSKVQAIINTRDPVTSTETFYFEEEEMLPIRRDSNPSAGRQLVRSAEVVNADLVARITDMVTRSIGNGSGEMKIEANQIRTVQPDGTRVRQTSLVVGVVIDAKRNK